MGRDVRQYDWYHTRSSWRKWKRALKKSTSRARRRDEQRLGEDAPPRATRGWVR